ncbi:hypothetical protein MTO96_039455 [Rhipicephalus appendiculatus]
MQRNTVHGASQLNLPGFVHDALSLGPKFAVEKKRPPEELLSMVRQLARLVPDEEASRVVSEVKAIICTVSETTTSANMYPSDFCDYLFYTNVYAENGRIYAIENYRTWILFQRMAAKRRNMEFGISFSWE